MVILSGNVLIGEESFCTRLETSLWREGSCGGTRTPKETLDRGFPHGQTAQDGLHPNHQKTMNQLARPITRPPKAFVASAPQCGLTTVTHYVEGLNPQVSHAEDVNESPVGSHLQHKYLTLCIKAAEQG